MLFYFACEAAARRAPGIPCALLLRAGRSQQNSRSICGEIAKLCREARAVSPVVIPGARQREPDRNIATAWELFVRAIRACQGFCSRGEPARHPPRHCVASQECLARYEFPVAVFTPATRPLHARTSCRDGAADADAGRTSQPGAAAAERGLLWPACDVRRIDHRGSLARDADRTRKSRCAGNLLGSAGRWMARGGRRGARQGRVDLSTTLARRTCLAIPAIAHQFANRPVWRLDRKP